MSDQMSMMVRTFTILLIVFTTKHLVADFLLQTNWIARGKEGRSRWLLPLLAHVACHALMTLGIALIFAAQFWWLALVDFIVHFTIDRGKTSLCQSNRLTPQDEKFWWLLGFDQYLHQVTNILFAGLMVGL